MKAFSRSPFPLVLPRLCALAVILPLAGCAVQPVQPWQRGTLAGPAMAWDAEPMRASQQRQIDAAPAQETRSAAQEADFWERPENNPR